MERSLQKVNYNNQLLEWSRRVERCRNSGLTVKQWCKENKIAVSTYYLWQKRVFKATTACNEEVCFAEVPAITGPAPVSSPGIAATVQLPGISIEVYPGADAATIQAIIQAVKSC